jgi:hypothetical protein
VNLFARSPTGGQAKKRKARSKAQAVGKVSQLIQKRRDYLTKWKEIRDYQLPYLGVLEESEFNTQHQRRDSKIYTGTAWECCNIFAAGIMSGLTPPSRNWFKLSFANPELMENKEASMVLDERNTILEQVLSSSNFYNAAQSVYMELPFGIGALGVFPDAKTGVRFTHYPIGTYCIDVGADGIANTFCRKYKMYTSQIAEQFGIENLPHRLKCELDRDGGLASQHTVCCLIEPNKEYDRHNPSRLTMPYTVVYWLDGSADDEWLHIGGAYEMPIAVARCLVTGLEPYAKGAGWFALGDSKMLQALERDLLVAVQLGVRPPMQADVETAAKGINIIPGAANATNMNGGIKPIFDVKLDIKSVQEKIEATKDAIKRAYNADLFLTISSLEKGQMTAREVMERSQEKLQQLGPVVERLEFEFLSVILERVYNILERAGAFPPFPQEMMEQLSVEEVKIDYISPLAQAQKMSGLTAIEQLFAFTGTIAQMFPEVADKIDALEAIDKYAAALGSPAAILRSDEEVAKMQEARRQAQAMAQQQEAFAQSAPALNQTAQAARNFREAVGGGDEVMAKLIGVPNV